MFLFKDSLHHFFNVFVCAEPSKRKGRNSKKPYKTCICSYIFRIRGFRILIKIITSKVRFSSQRRRPFGHRFFIDFSSMLAPFSHCCFFCFFFDDFFDVFFNDVFASMFNDFWTSIFMGLGPKREPNSIVRE